MSGAPDNVCRLPRVANIPTVRLPMGGQNTIASGAAVNAGMSVPLGLALIVSALAPATLVFATDAGPVSVNVAAGVTRLELAANATSFTVTSIAITILWTEDFREP